MVKKVVMNCCLAACWASFAMCDTIAYFPSAYFYSWNLDDPALAPHRGAELPGDAIDILLSPDGKRFVIPTNLRDHPGGESSGALMFTGPCCSDSISLVRIRGVRDFWNGAVIAPDGKKLYIIGTPSEGGCQFLQSSFACLIIDLQAGTLLNSFCTNQVWLGPNDRVYYVPLPSSEGPKGKQPLMSRDPEGKDERIEIQDIPYREGGLLNGVIGIDERLYVVLDEHCDKAHEGFYVYLMKNTGALDLKFRHSGRFLRSAHGEIFYKPLGGMGLAVLDCRNPGQDKVLTEYFSTTPPPYKDIDILAEATLKISADGKKHFYIVDHGNREPIDLYVYDIEKKSWSDKYSTPRPFNGGIPAPVLLSDPCRKGTPAKP